VKSQLAELPRRTEELATELVDAAYSVHSELGPGLLESVYERCLCHELSLRGIQFEQQVVLPIAYKDLVIDGGLRLDLIVERHIVVELKAVEKIITVHRAQILTYMKLAGYRLGFLINFNVPRIKQGIERLIL
jgi:GxxExxY protein